MEMLKQLKSYYVQDALKSSKSEYRISKDVQQD